MGKKFDFYCNDAQNLDQDSLLFYKEALSRYPFCQYAHLMFLLNLKQTGDEDMFRTVLPHVAIMLPDRIRLKEQVSALGAVDAVEKESFRRSAPNRFSPFQDSLPQRQSEGFSPWAQALPVATQGKKGTPAMASATAPAGSKTGADPQSPFARSNREEGRSSGTGADKQPAGKGAARQPEAEPPGTDAEFPDFKPVSRSVPDSRARKEAIIDRFLQSGGEHLIALDEDFDYNSFDPDTGHSSREEFSIGSETLAGMYLKNGAPEKAIAVYAHLGLKFPEKSSYFANLIRKVKKDYSIK